jgi:hypothetical protein
MQITRGYSMRRTPTQNLDRKPERAIHPDRAKSDPHPDRAQHEEHAAGAAATTEYSTHRSRQ